MVRRAASRYSARTPRTSSDSRASVNAINSGVTSTSDRCRTASRIRVRSWGTAWLLPRKSATIASRSTPAASSTSATAKPVRSLPAKQCVSAARPSASKLTTRCSACCAPLYVGNLLYSSTMKRVDATLTGSSSDLSSSSRLNACSWGASPSGLSSSGSRSGMGNRWMSTSSGTKPGPWRCTSRRDRRSATSVMPNRRNSSRPSSPSSLNSPERNSRPGRSTPVLSATSRKFQAPCRSRTPDAISGDRRSESAFLPADLGARDGPHVHLVGSVENTHGAVPGVEPGQRRVVADPGRAMDLDGTVDDIAGHLRRHRLDLRDQQMGGPVAVLVDCPRRLLAQQPGLIDPIAGLSNCLLHETLVNQWTAECHPITGPVDHQGQRAFGSAQRAHAVVDAPRPQPGLGDREPGAFFGE